MKSLLCLGLALLITAPAARGAVVYSGLQNIPIPTTFDGVFVDVDTGGTSAAPFAGWDFNLFFGGVGMANSVNFQPVRISTSNDSAMLNLPTNTLINGASTFSSGEGGSGDIGNEHLGSAANQFPEGVEGFIGFRFTKNDTTGPFYGWAQVTLTANTSGGLIHDWAWENSGAGIATPEPGRLMLLVVGALCVVVRRRRL